MYGNELLTLTYSGPGALDETKALEYVPTAFYRAVLQWVENEQEREACLTLVPDISALTQEQKDAGACQLTGSSLRMVHAGCTPDGDVKINVGYQHG